MWPVFHISSIGIVYVICQYFAFIKNCLIMAEAQLHEGNGGNGEIVRRVEGGQKNDSFGGN